MSGGTFSVARSIWDHEAFKPEPFSEREAFMWLVSEASFMPRRHRGVALERGQLSHSVRFMAERWQWSKSRVSRVLQKWKKRDMLRYESGTATLLITVCDYDEYQPEVKRSGTAAGQQAGHDRDSSGTNEKKEEIRDIGSVANATGAAAPDPAKLVFDHGVRLLTASGRSEQQARSILGRWRKQHQDPAIITAISAAQREGAIDPVSFVERCLRNTARQPVHQVAGGSIL